jgi:hypothetical protein
LIRTVNCVQIVYCKNLSTVEKTDVRRYGKNGSPQAVA